MSYSMLSTCTFIQTMLKSTPVKREVASERDRGVCVCVWGGGGGGRVVSQCACETPGSGPQTP